MVIVAQHKQERGSRDMADDKKRFYTTKEVAEIMGICLSNVYEGLRTGEIPIGIRVGRRWLIPQARFDEWWGWPDSSIVCEEPSVGKPCIPR